MINYQRTTVEGAVPGKNPPEAFLTERGSGVDSMNYASAQGKWFEAGDARRIRRQKSSEGRTIYELYEDGRN